MSPLPGPIPKLRTEAEAAGHARADTPRASAVWLELDGGPCVGSLKRPQDGDTSPVEELTWRLKPETEDTLAVLARALEACATWPRPWFSRRAEDLLLGRESSRCAEHTEETQP